MTEFQGWIVIAELSVIALLFARSLPAQMKMNQIEVTKVGDGHVHGRDRHGRQCAVDMHRIVSNNSTSPKIGDIVTFR